MDTAFQMCLHQRYLGNRSMIAKILNIIAEEIGVERDELTDDSEFVDYGVNGVLAKAIVARIANDVNTGLQSSIFDDYPTVADLRDHLEKQLELPTRSHSNRARATPKDPLSFILQCQPATASKTLFLLPDGSGSSMGYARLPRIDLDIYLIALNSPFLRGPNSSSFTVESIFGLWVQEVQRRQPRGPYYLSGWSAGGYYSFAVTKLLVAKGENVEKLILIDSPCRLVYEELPMEVVRYLSSHNLMGNWGDKKPPEWLVNHFDISIRAISKYKPSPMRADATPDVSIIWA
ncbi:alpha/beta-hydrolase [Bimuria novae-zelandiae CBS 107.79]|uniref:Alpha/beta-hydrolase n=1 Tax=Bimuria novae-zelandiae CBS 107.79 TaxID=1447943 RepID=A0A6A5URF9_9PLEO|nr:alpha/beta-hydrolase [Bimuria novae-zelandiae CBS 107.79]